MIRQLLILGFMILLLTPAYGVESERISVNLPRTIYMAGESVLFKIGLDLGGSISPSQIAYAELVDRNGQPVAQEIIRINGKLQEGHINIPLDIPSDHYLLRAYSRMGLANLETISNQFITVINPVRPPVGLSSRVKIQEESDDQEEELKKKLVYGTKEQVTYRLPKGELNIIQLSVSPKNPFLDNGSSGKINKVIYKEKEFERLIPELYGHVVKAKSMREKVDTTETFFLSAHGSKSMLFSGDSSLNCV